MTNTEVRKACKAMAEELLRKSKELSDQVEALANQHKGEEALATIRKAEELFERAMILRATAK